MRGKKIERPKTGSGVNPFYLRPISECPRERSTYAKEGPSLFYLLDFIHDAGPKVDVLQFQRKGNISTWALLLHGYCLCLLCCTLLSCRQTNPGRLFSQAMPVLALLLLLTAHTNSHNSRIQPLAVITVMLFFCSPTNISELKSHKHTEVSSPRRLSSD